MKGINKNLINFQTMPRKIPVVLEDLPFICTHSQHTYREESTVLLKRAGCKIDSRGQVTPKEKGLRKDFAVILTSHRTAKCLFKEVSLKEQNKLHKLLSARNTCTFKLRNMRKFKPVFKTNRFRNSFITFNSLKA